MPVALKEEFDWRGPVGHLHRTVTPYMEIHEHGDPTELISWYQLTLKLNPNIERLYSFGAFFIADFAGEPEKAYEVLEAGVEANPWTFEIRAALGRHIVDYHDRLSLPPEKPCAGAPSLPREAIDREKEEKAHVEKSGNQFNVYQEQLFAESYLFLAKSLTELGKYEDAIAACEEGYKTTGHNLLKVQKRVTTKRMNENTSPPAHQTDAL